MAAKKVNYRTVHKSVWDACKAFPTGHYREALALIYLESGPLAHWTGLYPAATVDIAEHTRLTVQEVEAAIVNLERWGLIVYDHDRQLVYVKGMLVRQLKGDPNECHQVGINRHLEAFADCSPAVSAFNAAATDRV